MTGENRGIDAAGPPWSVDLLADLHAGVLGDAEAEQLWARVNADSEARAIVEAIEATTSDLAALGAVSSPPMPADVAARIDASLAREIEQTFGLAPAVDIGAARRRRNKRIGWITGVVAVTAAAVTAVIVLLPTGGTVGGNRVAQPPPAGQQVPLAVRSDYPEAAIGRLSSGAKDYGSLGSADKLDACLRGAGFAPTADPIGVSAGTVDGQPAVLVLLTTGNIARFRLVAFAPTCGVRNSEMLLDKTVGK